MTRATEGADDSNRFYVAASSDTEPAERFVLKHDDTFAIVDRIGDISPMGRSEQGLYHDGTKFVSMLRLRVQGKRPLLLSSSMTRSNVLLQVELANPDLYEAREMISVPYGTVHIARSKFCDSASLFERIVLSNYGAARVSFELALEFSADFVDVFEVRGTRRAERGTLLPPQVDADCTQLSYLGRDGVMRRTCFSFSPAPTELLPGRARFSVNLESKCSLELSVRVECRSGEHAAPAPRSALTFETALSSFEQKVSLRECSGCKIVTSNDAFNDWLEVSQADLRMLLSETPQGLYPYAGVPWFSTPFGRDGIWAALETLWLRPEIAKGVLLFLSEHQARVLDPAADAEPGKIFHEMRAGEMAALKEIPFGCYYGSIDSTPLYLMLAARYFARTSDRRLIEVIWPNLMAALEWMERFGDLDGDGFIEYGRRSKDGLIQQGWKDSNDSVFHRDGSLAAGPIALAEVQGYAYAALRGMATIAAALDKPDLERQLTRRAQALRERFDAAFFCEELSMYALALDASKRPCRVRSSNAGHCLYTGVAFDSRAAELSAELLSPRMFSGWGIRTLANDEQRYNPMSYHNGSIWPHDNAILAAGLAAYGYKAAALRVFAAMFDATQFMNLGRLPELFCGFERSPGQGPTLYPVACSPQAWASGAVFLLLEAILGLEVDAINGRLLLRHAVLPPFLGEVEIHGLRVGDADLDLRLQYHEDDVGVTIIEKRGRVEVLAIK
jgi:glycogen debranching enzyme